MPTKFRDQVLWVDRGSPNSMKRVAYKCQGRSYIQDHKIEFKDMFVPQEQLKPVGP